VAGITGLRRIGILGTSLGSCLSLLTAAHEPRVRAQALNHISPYFADVVWRGLSTTHVREGLEGAVELDRLREMWLPISPHIYLDRIKNTKTLLVYAKYDLTFPSTCRGSSSTSSTAGRSHTSWRSCRAGTTRPASRRSSFSMALSWRGF
jgi:hypothetical protein